jgi:hypothetical protein
MKKSTLYIILTLVVLYLPAVVMANSGPTYWQGYPSSEIMLVKNNSPITVENEELVFDFSDYKGRSYTVDGKVTATYEMVNPTNKAQSVQMAFPFVGTLNNLMAEDVEVSVDRINIPYEIYIGDVVGNYRNSLEDGKEEIFDFTNIINTITDKPYQGENFTENEKGKLYIIDIKPTSEEIVNLAVDFNLNFEKTKVLTKGFNRYERNDDKIRIAAGCYEPETLEIFVLGEDIDLNINGYTDGELKEKTNLFTYQLYAQEMEFKSYLMNYDLMSYVKENADRIRDEMVSELQLYNMHAKSIDECFTQNLGYSSDNDILDQWSSKRILTLVYTVEFPQNSEKEVRVRYKTSGTMDMRETAKPLYSFDYILNPAKNWSDFKNLNIEIITPQKAPYIVQSSIELTKGKKNTYSATLESLPEKDLSFTLYSSEQVTFLDKARGAMGRSFGYFAPFVIGVIVIFLVIVLTIILVAKRNKKV